MPRNLDPAGPGNDLLELWGTFRRGGLPGEGGGQWAVKERLDRAHDDEPPEVLQIDRALARLWRQYDDYEGIVKRRYLDGRAVWEIAANMRYTPGFVSLSLQAVCDYVERQINACAPVRERA